MKTNYFKSAALAVLTGLFLLGCGTSKQASSSNTSNSTSPFGRFSEAPCAVFDDEENFAATGIASGPSTQKGTLQKTALSNGQGLIRQKIRHAYEGVIKDYFEHIGSNKGSDVETQTLGGGNQIIMDIINNASHCCLMWSDIDDKGNIECYMGIKISKSKIANAIADNLSKNEKEDIRKHAEDFRKQMIEDLKNYKGE